VLKAEGLARTRDELLPGLRSALADPNILFYRVRKDAVEIIRVLHGRRDIASIFARRADG